MDDVFKNMCYLQYLEKNEITTLEYMLLLVYKNKTEIFISTVEMNVSLFTFFYVQIDVTVLA